MNDPIQPNDIAQIVDAAHPWFPCLLIVDEVKAWGVQAHALVPQSNDGSARPASYYIRLTFGQIVKVGACVVVEAQP